MEKDRLIERLNFTLAKKDVLVLAHLFTEMEGGVTILFDLCKSENDTLSFHAAWVLENVLIPNSDLFSFYLLRIIEEFPTIKNPSTKRHFSKLLNHAMEECNMNSFPKDGCILFINMDMEPIVESCFEWLMDPTIKPSVKVHCMDILTHLAKRYDWIAEDLPHVIELQMIDGTPGLRNKGKKVIESLRKAR